MSPAFPDGTTWPYSPPPEKARPDLGGDGTPGTYEAAAAYNDPERRYPLEGWVAFRAQDHLADRDGRCTCGFAAWSGEHVAVMAYREAVEDYAALTTREARRG